MVSFNHWLSSIKTNTLSRYETLVNANHAWSNWAQNATFFTIMADETSDISNKEQLVVCIHWVDENFAVHEDFIAMYPLERTTANHVVAVLKNCLISMHLRIKNARGQHQDFQRSAATDGDQTTRTERTCSCFRRT